MSNFKMSLVGTGAKRTSEKGDRMIQITLDPAVREMADIDLTKLYLKQWGGTGHDYRIFGIVPTTTALVSLMSIS